ncbi:hypothetical protein [Clostridium neonatale]|uniref:hypothetical protein n=1 Tax=Clostridium neonatale TaxID=137838 RepID=UPI00291B69BA|nr:conserved hypothetical protein [Clostridium neonatale]
MRLAIRDKILKDTDLKECYEPNVPDKQTQKPYAVTVFKDDTDNGEVLGFKRSIEIWIYDERLSFKSLDKLAEDIIKSLDLKSITDPKIGENFTCRFDGIVGQDVVDEEWNAIAKGLKFTVIALHDEQEENTDKWLNALSDFTKDITEWPVYLNNWKSNFEVPSILWRVQKQSKERESNTLVKENKTLVCHIVSKSKSEISKLIDIIEDNLIDSLKIPYDLADRRYLTIESINEDREADMLTKGQLTVEFFRRRMVKKEESNTIEEINSIGILKEV